MSAGPRPVSDTRRIVRLLRRFLKGLRRTFVIAFVLLAFEAVTAIFEAYPLAYLIDYFKGDKPGFTLPWDISQRTGTVLVLTAAILILAVINSTSDSMAEIFLANGGRRLGYNLRIALFSHLQRLSLAFHHRARTGDVITRVTGDVNEVEDFVTKSVSDFVGSLLVLAGSLAFLIYKAWQVALVALLFMPVLGFVSYFFSSRIKAVAKRQRARQGELATSTQEMLTSIRVVQIFGRARHGDEHFERQSTSAMDASLDLARYEAMFSFTVSVLEALSIGAVVWIGLWMLDQSLITVGTLVFLVILVGNMFRPTRRIVKEWNTVGKVYASIERIGDVLEREPTVRDLPGAVPAPRIRGGVEFRDVSFAYELEPEDRLGEEERHRAALHHVSFAVAPGEVVALVGPSGAGKSTVAQLLPRLYDPQSGAVLLDGRDVREFTLESLREQMSMVLQDTVLFHGTVAENIAYGRAGATEDEVAAAARLAHAHEFIEGLPEGYRTDLSERAQNLSGGQRQRIAIARAFIRDTPVLILDEPTTGLDAESTDLVLGALRTLMKGKTTLIISHDLSLVRCADRILVMRAGRIEQVGTHTELLDTVGLFADLHARQTADPASQATSTSPVAVDANGGEPDAAGNRRPTAFDPLRSQRLAADLPQLATLLDGEAMRSPLQKALLDGDGETRIVSCTPTKALLTPGGGMRLRYDVGLAGPNGGPHRRATIGARVFPQGASATASVLGRLDDLGARLVSRGTEQVLAPVGSVDALSMATYAFPIDPELPTLIDATDPEQMAAAIDALIPEFSVDSCRVEVVHYPRRGHCVLRYELSGRDEVSGKPGERTVYGRLAERHDPRVDRVVSDLRERFNRWHAGPILPRPIGYLPRLRLSLSEAIPGRATVAELVRARMSGARGADLSLERALDLCAITAAAIHRSGLETVGVRTFDGELTELASDVARLRPVAAELSQQLELALQRIADGDASGADGERVLCHGDFTPGQILLDGTRWGVVDFVTICMADPAMDLGRFTAYLRLACRKAEPSGGVDPVALADKLCERFMLEYVAGTGLADSDCAHLRGRVAAFEALALAQITIRSWEKIKPQRTAMALSILEERLACLPMSQLSIS